MAHSLITGYRDSGEKEIQVKLRFKIGHLWPSSKFRNHNESMSIVTSGISFIITSIL